MKRAVRRLLYAVLLLLWLIVLLFPVLAGVLATREQIVIGDDVRNQVRVFLIRESESRGIGVDWTRPADDRPDCSQSRLAYVMWRGQGENATFCSCYGSDGSLRSSEPGLCPALTPD